MAYDSTSAATVLFGGSALVSGPPLADTWRWDGITWTQLQPTTSPPALLAHAMASDFVNGRIVLFGGRDTQALARAETWVFDGVTWTQLLGVQPPARFGHDLAFDPVSGSILLFGGAAAIGGAVLGDTWQLAATGWVQLQPATHPLPRWGHRMAYSPALNGIVMHGGASGFPPPLDDTWLWNGTDWQLLANAPQDPSLYSHVLQMDWNLGRIVTFGGATASQVSDATWTFGATVPGAFTASGTGCAGPAGTPQLTATAPPWIGSTPTLTLAPTPSLGVFVVGLSNTVSGSLPLPASLSSIGMPGCSLFVSLDVLVARAPVANATTLAIPIPYQPALVGQQFFVQGASFDLAANPLGLTMSNALAATIGWL